MRTLDLFYSRHNKGQPSPPIRQRPISYYELTAVLRGQLTYEVNGEVALVEAGDAVFVRPNSIRTRPAEDGVDYISFNFRSSDEFSLPLLVKGALVSEARLIIDAYDRINDGASTTNNEANGHLLGALISLIEEEIAREGLNPLTVKITSYINMNFKSRITLEDVGRLTFFSPIYCDTVFKKDTGHSIIDYLITRRIDEAKKQLLGTTIPLSEIASLCGFSDYNYFCRVFKKRVGTTPSAYRRMLIE